MGFFFLSVCNRGSNVVHDRYRPFGLFEITFKDKSFYDDCFDWALKWALLTHDVVPPSEVSGEGEQ